MPSPRIPRTADAHTPGGRRGSGLEGVELGAARGGSRGDARDGDRPGQLRHDLAGPARLGHAREQGRQQFASGGVRRQATFPPGPPTCCPARRSRASAAPPPAAARASPGSGGRSPAKVWVSRASRVFWSLSPFGGRCSPCHGSNLDQVDRSALLRVDPSPGGSNRGMVGQSFTRPRCRTWVTKVKVTSPFHGTSSTQLTGSENSTPGVGRRAPAQQGSPAARPARRRGDPRARAVRASTF